MGWIEYDSENGYEYFETKWFYAVGVGRRTGIFTKREDAVEQVHGFPGFRMRKFSDYEEAREYLEEFDIYCDSLTEESEREEEIEEEEEDDIWFYAVAVGRSTGVFLAFEDARDQIYGFPRSRMEAFHDYDEAEQYVENNRACFSEEKEKEELEKKSAKVWFYAVAVGRSTGVFMNYADAMEQVHGYSGFRMKKFRDYDEAQEYIAFNQVYSSDEEEESDEEENQGVWYYAVAVGRCTGVYTNLEQAKDQVHGYSGFLMKKFLDYGQAQAYVRDNEICSFEEEAESPEVVDERWYYAVAVGRRIGIYTDHNDAIEQVHGYSGFKMKKFLDYDNARDYLDAFRENSSDTWYEESNNEESYQEEETWFYAVAVGRSPGIYTNCEDAIDQVHGFSGFRMKKFIDYDEAQEYLDHNQQYSSEEEWESEDDESQYDEEDTWYYAVAVGRATGVYTNWQHAMNQVHGYSGFQMKKFLDYREAQEYLKRGDEYEHVYDEDDTWEYEGR
ncbi:unnamed protein product [Phytophthora lilii]|uniref:ribonuclease H n=1 Tax=Phytophthora lilii TaxID=2077276 RepID=A0A9W6TFL1_9STRA|nr:unnamed protein product [Phytophthora lilii]